MCSEGELNRTESFSREMVGSGGLGCGGVGLLGTIAASPLKAISTGPQDMAALSPPAEKSSAGASHLSAAQPRLKKIRFLLASSQHTHFYVQCVHAKQSKVFARRHGAAMDRHTWLPGIVVLVLSTVSLKKKKKNFLREHSFVIYSHWQNRNEKKRALLIFLTFVCQYFSTITKNLWKLLETTKWLQSGCHCCSVLLFF